VAILKVERVGGLAGFGGVASRVKSQGEVHLESLSDDVRQQVTQLLKPGPVAPASAVRDGFRYRLSLTTGSDVKQAEIPEELVPDAIRKCVKDVLT